MFGKYIKTTTYNATFSLATLEKYLDSDFLALLLETLHVKSLSESFVQVDYASSGLTFSHLEKSEE